MKLYDDKKIIEQIKNGEIDKFSVIVKEYTSVIHIYIKAKLFNKNEADDLVQNTFVSFYKALSHFDETRPVLPYLYQIARNELKMYYRSRKEMIILDDKIQVADEKQDNFFEADYETLLHQLNTEQQTILELLREGYSYKEIAGKIKRPVNTVRTMIRRTRLQVKKIRNEQS